MNSKLPFEPISNCDLVLVRSSANGPIVGHLGKQPIAKEILDERGRAGGIRGTRPAHVMAGQDVPATNWARPRWLLGTARG